MIVLRTSTAKITKERKRTMNITIFAGQRKASQSLRRRRKNQIAVTIRSLQKRRKKTTQ